VVSICFLKSERQPFEAHGIFGGLEEFFKKHILTTPSGHFEQKSLNIVTFILINFITAYEECQ